MKKLVIAYSGGLDTSYCAVSLSKAGYDVHAVSVNTGGFTKQEIEIWSQYLSNKLRFIIHHKVATLLNFVIDFFNSFDWQGTIFGAMELIYIWWFV